MKKLYTKYITLLIFTFLFSTQSFAYDSLKTKHSTILTDFGSDIMIGLSDAGAFYTMPLHFDGKEWFYTAAITDGIVVSSTLDWNIKQKVSRNGASGYNHNFWDIPTVYGDVFYPATASGMVYAIGLFTRNDKIRITGRLLIEAMCIAGVTTTAVKMISGRDRPFYRNDQNWFKLFQTKNEHLSFPSGHATVAFAVSSVLAEYFDNNYLRVGLYGFAALTAYARVRNNQHWFSDVITGGLIGFASGYFVVHREKDREESKYIKSTGGKGISIYPGLSGVSIVWRW